MNPERLVARATAWSALLAVATSALSACYSGHLPAGSAPAAATTAADDFSFVALATGSERKLSDFRGKVVVLDFWATWCPPCQTAVANLQKYRAAHPEWGDRVELITLSLDAERGQAERRLQERGWNSTFNGWLGESSAAPDIFGVRTIPHAVVLDASGRQVASGHPGRLGVPALVNRLLGQTGS